MKRSIISLILVSAMVFVFASCNIIPIAKPDNTTTAATPQTDAPATPDSTAPVSEPDTASTDTAPADSASTDTAPSADQSNQMNIDPSLQVEKEYIIKGSLGIERCLVIKNVSDKAVSVESNSAAYNNGSIVSAEDGDISALAPGYTGLLVENFDTKSEITSFSSNITANELNEYSIPLKDYTIETTILPDKAILQCKYDGELDSFSPVIYVVFFKNGEPVYLDWNYKDLPKGATISIESEPWGVEFDSVEVYAHGYEFNV